MRIGVIASNDKIPLVSLRDAGLVETRRESQVIHCRLNSKTVAGTLQALYRINCDPNNEEQVI
jgi:DNA-binding transcriptional ArsR family regulator